MLEELVFAEKVQKVMAEIKKGAEAPFPYFSFSICYRE